MSDTDAPGDGATYPASDGAEELASSEDGDELPSPAVHPGQRVRDAKAYRELLHFLPDVLRLLWDLSRDPRVPRLSKVAALAVAGYLISPIDVLPDFLPGLGQLDDLYLAVWAVRRLVADAGYDLVREHWRGSDDGFALLLVAAGIRR